MPKDACYHKVKARYKVFPSAYASGAIAKCRKVGAANYGTGGKKKKKKDGGLMEAIKRVDRQQSMKAKEGKVVRMTKRKSKNPNIARGCGAIMSSRRKKTKYA
tara:strand:- start:440 stop:748 length:309 start_codon:yes stop_codon:yes gene_type:complete